MNHPRSAATGRPLHPLLTPEEQARVEAYRTQFKALGMTDDEIEHPNEPCTPEQEAALKAWERGEKPWPFEP